MPSTKSDLAPPFDQGIFLLHYNRGREAFQEGRYAEARKELEFAQRMRPSDTDVLNLLGLVYFKTSAFPEAEVIYRRLVETNRDVFILHSNLGLILFKQGKLDEAEKYLRRAVELRPNYQKSHLYLGLLYKEKEKFGLALEHLRFAGAERAVREIEQMKLRSEEEQVPAAPEPSDDAPVEPEITNTMPQTGPNAVTTTGHAVARKLQQAVDETAVVDDRGRIDLGRKIEGASKTLALHENGFLEINFRRSVYVKRGTVSSYSGNLRFVAESSLAGTTASTLFKAQGPGRIFLYEKGRKTFLLDLNDEFIYVEGSNLLAMEDTLSYRVESIYDSSYQNKIDAIKIFGRGSLALSTYIEPLTMRVTRDYPLSISSIALVAWTGNLIPTVIDESQNETVMIEADPQAFRIRFEGDGVVVSEQ